MPSIKYLSYGSNLHPLRLQERVSSAELIGTVMIGNYRLWFHKTGRDGSAKCNIVHSSSSADIVLGAIYAIDLDDKPVLDAIEGLGNGYQEHWLELNFDGAQQRAFTYQASAAHIDVRLRPYDWYHALVVHGASYHSLPADYIGAIKRVATMPDPDPRRSAMHQQLLERMSDY